MNYVVKTPNGKLIADTIAETKIGAIFNLDLSSNDINEADKISEIIWYNGSTDPDAIRKRVYRAGYKVVPVKVVEIKG